MNSPIKQKLDTLCAKAESLLLAKPGSDHRVVEELHNLSGQFFAGTLLRSLLMVLRDAVIAAALIVAVHTAAAYLLCGGVSEWRCLFQTIAIGIALPLLIIVGLVSAVVSYYSTSRIHERRFQHSALMSAFVLILLCVALFFGEAPWWLFGAEVVVVFFSMYLGYRKTFTQRGV